jgi:hypothetical protein
MGLDFSSLVYYPCQEIFGRPVTVTPVVSLPGQAAYAARGIYGTRALIIEGGIAGAEFSDQQTVLYIREVDFPATPQQGDHIAIPNDGSIPPPGRVSPNDPPTEFVVTDAPFNGGGETTLVLQRIVS